MCVCVDTCTERWNICADAPKDRKMKFRNEFTKKLITIISQQGTAG